MKITFWALLLTCLTVYAQPDVRAENLLKEVDKFEELVGGVGKIGITAEELQGYIDNAEITKRNIVKCTMMLESDDTRQLDSILNVKDRKQQIVLLESWKQKKNTDIKDITTYADQVIRAAASLKADIEYGMNNEDSYALQDYRFVAERDYNLLVALLQDKLEKHKAILQENKNHNKKQ